MSKKSNLMFILYNFRNDIKNPNGDPDSSSYKLKEIHKQLWSKSLPSGKMFELRVSGKRIEGYLDGKLTFFFGPDSFVNTLSKSKRNNYC